ncbi:MAG: AMP-binding protein [Bacteroidia bacterium]|jgi:O-succinylbenzoic acid--CoA ligase
MLNLHHRSYPFDEIKKSLGNGTSHHPAWQLAHDWLTGKKEFIFQTSGSTGIPKDLKFSREKILASVKRTTEALKLSSKDHFLCCLSMQSVAGAMMLIRAVELKATITVLESNSKPLAQISDAHPFTSLSLVPMQMHELPEHPAWMQKLDRFKTILIGGATLNPNLEKLLMSCRAQVYQTYGMTETLSHIALHRIGEQEAFHPLKGIEIKTDDRGCMCIKADITNGEWLVTNDLVEILPDQTFRLLGRADQVINTGGHKVMPGKIEQAIGKYLHNKPFFIFGVPHSKFGEQVTLFVEGKEDKSIDKWWSKLDETLHQYEIPKQIIWMNMFHKTTSGKIDKARTAKELQQATA